MKKTLTVAFMFSLLLFTVSRAAIITVDNKHPYAGDYKTLQEAHDAATNGDIIYVSSSLIPYDGITVTKPLTFYGVGFDITENFSEPMTPTALISGTMNFNAGSEGSHIEGFDGNFVCNININDILIKRNYLSSITIFSLGSGSTIIQNKIVNNSWGHNINGVDCSASDILVSNNILMTPNDGHPIFGGTEYFIYNNIILTNESSAALTALKYSQIINNIILSGTIEDCATSTFIYNMSNSNQLPEGNGNINNVDMNTVFVDYANYDFHLLPNSPAKGAGQNGTDMGIYGGDTPYVDSGFPGLPSILQIQAPNAGSQQSGLDINFKAKSNKE